MSNFVKKLQSNPTGYVIYRGPSMLDGAPIVCVAIVHSDNRKTGDVVQTYILREDIAPLDAIASGADSSICGDCKHRGNGDGTARTCYVNVGQGASRVWETYRAGNYPHVSPAHIELQKHVSGRVVRLGAYGDPAAVPIIVWRILLRNAAGNTGYSHQWRRFPEFREFAMASVDNPAEYAQAIRDGWRTFRAKLENQEKLEREVFCPSVTHGVQCADCRLCDGNKTSAKNVVIDIHGNAPTMKAAREASHMFA